MKKGLVLAGIVLLFLEAGIAVVPAPSGLSTTPRMVGWLAYDGNPVVSPGASGSWDAQDPTSECVLLCNEGLLLYYSASNSSAKGPSVGLATSPDGTNWTKNPANPVLAPGGAGSWDSLGVAGAAVIKENGTYKMWYSGTDGSLWRIGYATSTDGKSWTRHPGNPVLDAGPEPSWDDERMLQPCVLKDPDGYRMYYAGHDGFHSNIGLAFSGDGVRWTKSPANPVLPMGAGWEKDSVGSPCVIFDGDKYRIWYGGLAGGTWSIGHGQSWDGKSWVRHPENPVLEASQPWESGGAFSPAAWFDGSTYRMLYTGIGSKGQRAIGFALGNSVPDAPTELDPSSFELLPLKMPEMTWRTDDPDRHIRDKMTAYEIQISDDPSFAVLIYSTGKQFSEVASHRPWKELSDGTHYWRVRTWDDTDQCGPWSEAAAFRVDTVPPVNPKILTCNTHKPGLWSSNNSINVSWVLEKDEYGDPELGFTSISPGEPVNITPDVIDAGEAGGYAYSPALADGADYHFHFRAVDRAGNRAAEAIRLGPFLIDTTPPEIMSVGTSDDDGIVNHSDVTLQINASDPSPGSGLAEMRIGQDGGRGTDWEPFEREKRISFKDREGPRQIQVWVRDRAGNTCTPFEHLLVVDGFCAQQSVCGDLENCTTGTCRRPDPSGCGSEDSLTSDYVTNSRSFAIYINASDPEPSSGIAGIAFSFDNLTWGSWEPYACRTRVMLPEGDGRKTVYVRVTDRAGNIGPPSKVIVFLDTEPAQRVEVEIECSSDYECTTGNRAPVYDPHNETGSLATNNRTVRVGLHATDPEPGSGLYEMAFCTDGPDWSGWEPFSQVKNLTLPEGEGGRTVKVRLRDQAGNIAEAQGRPVLLDKKAPGAVSVVINGGTAATNNSTVRLRISAVDPEPASGLWDMTFSEDGANWTDWEPFNETKLYTFSRGDGNKTLQVRVGDRAMNAAAPVGSSILVDTTRPSIISIKVRDIGRDRATVEVVLSEPCSVELDYGTSRSYGKRLDSPVPGTTHVIKLGKLSPGQKSHFRVLAEDRVGNPSEPSEDREFTTRPEPRAPMEALPLLAVLVAWGLVMRRRRARPVN